MVFRVWSGGNLELEFRSLDLSRVKSSELICILGCLWCGLGQVYIFLIEKLIKFGFLGGFCHAVKLLKP